jgi:hypothetical protein
MSPAGVDGSCQLRDLRESNDRLEERLERLRICYHTTGTFGEQKDQPLCLTQRRAELEADLRDLQMQLEALDAEVAKHRSTRPDDETTCEEHLAALLRDEERLVVTRRVRVERRKDEMKTVAKQQFAEMNAEKKLIEADIRRFAAAVENLKQVRGHFAQKTAGKRTSDISPLKRSDMTGRFESVGRAVVALENRKRVLEEFVAVRSPERYEQIISGRRPKVEQPSPRSPFCP